MKDIQITAKELKEKNARIVPGRVKDFSNVSFWYYTSLSTANLILENKCIYVSNIKNMNDLDEVELHKSDSEFVHGLCFCNSNSEKIPMWYLYAGITGKGVSIGLTPGTMIQFLNSIDTVVAVDDNSVLEKGKDFELDFGWVYYRKKDQLSQVKYRGKWYSITDDHNMNDFEEGNYFIKSYPWEYEKEFRIVFHNKTNKPHDKIKVYIDKILPKIKIRLAPELSPGVFISLLPNLKGFTSYLTTKLDYSNLGINMDLCKRNIDNFLDFLEAEKNKTSGRHIETKQIDRLLKIDKAFTKEKES